MSYSTGGRGGPDANTASPAKTIRTLTMVVAAVFLLVGVLGLWAARAASTAVVYLIAGGAIYLVLWLYGLVIDHDHSANFVPVNNADNWLHLVPGVAMIGLGVWGRRALPARSTRTA